MHNLFSETITNEQIINAFDNIYPDIKKAELVENTSLSRTKLDNGNLRIDFGIEFNLPIGADEVGEDFKISNGDTIKIKIGE